MKYGKEDDDEEEEEEGSLLGRRNTLNKKNLSGRFVPNKLKG